MNDSFDTETLQLLDETREGRIETRRDADSSEHRTIVWVVVVEGGVYVRSVRGQKAVRAALAADTNTVDAVSEAFRSKYERSSPASTAAMLRPDVLPTTLKLSPA